MPNGRIGRFPRSTMAHDMERRSLKISTANRPTDRQALEGRPPSLPPGNLASTPGAWSSDWRDELHGLHQGRVVYHLGSPPTGVPSGRRDKRFVSWICLNGR